MGKLTYKMAVAQNFKTPANCQCPIRVHFTQTPHKHALMTKCHVIGHHAACASLSAACTQAAPTTGIKGALSLTGGVLSGQTFKQGGPMNKAKTYQMK